MNTHLKNDCLPLNHVTFDFHGVEPPEVLAPQREHRLFKALPTDATHLFWSGLLSDQRWIRCRT